MKKTKNIRVMIVDDHAITRSGIKTLLYVYDDLIFAGEAVNGMDALNSYKKYRPDIILMDLEMPVLDGVSAISRIKKESPEIHIIVLTSFSDRKLVKNAIKAGAAGYVIKNISPEQLVQAIRDTIEGKISLSPEASEAIVEELKKPDSMDFNLTEQELKILRLLAEGNSNKEISSELFISPHTVKFHVSNLLNKLGASSRAEAVAIAARNNIKL